MLENKAILYIDLAMNFIFVADQLMLKTYHLETDLIMDYMFPFPKNIVCAPGIWLVCAQHTLGFSVI